MAARNDYSDFVDARQQAGELQIVMPQSKIISPAFWANPSLATPASSFPAQRPTARPYYPIIKRGLDIVIAVALLIAIAPILAIIAITIKLTSSGNVIFRQVRVGKDMRLFTCFKFRSMVDNAEWHLEQDAELCATHATSWKLKKDPRVTPIGRILRKLSLDELPQLINVIKGDMSLVGPRPYMPKELAGNFGERAEVITSVRPGMTGLWQVSGRALLTPSERIVLDERYASGISVKLDIFIIAKTFQVVLLSKGAF